ncbi:MAG: hypothetical protein AB1414_14690 [bacterium]
MVKYLPITSYQLPVTNYQLPVTNYQLPITSYQLPVTNIYSSGWLCGPIPKIIWR